MFSAPIYGIKKQVGITNIFVVAFFLKVKYVVAEETVSTMLNRFFRLEGALTVKRMWSEGKKIRRWLEGSDIRKIFDALKEN